VKTVKGADDSFYTLYQEQYSYFSFSAYISKMSLVTQIFLLLNCYINKMQLLQSLRKFYLLGSEPPWIFENLRKF